MIIGTGRPVSTARLMVTFGSMEPKVMVLFVVIRQSDHLVPFHSPIGPTAFVKCQGCHHLVELLEHAGSQVDTCEANV